jgi:hypothetical protein
MPKGVKGFQKGHKFHPRPGLLTPEERKAKQAAYRKSEAYKTRQRELGRKRYKERQDVRAQVRNQKLKRVFGITLKEYEDILIKQKGVCAICLKPENVKQQGKVRDLAVDHNHQTGKVRALLCNKCNIGIGVFLEDVLLLERAKDYLIAHNEYPV